MKKLLKRLLNDQDAASAIEYTLMAALLAAGILLAVQFFGSTVGKTFNSLNSTLGASTGDSAQVTVEGSGGR